MNRFCLIADVLTKQALRFTPAGVPILDIIVMHQSTVIEADLSRQVSFETEAVIVGPQAVVFNQLSLPKTVQFSGFFAVGRKGSSRLKLHVQDFKLLDCQSDCS